MSSDDDVGDFFHQETRRWRRDGGVAREKTSKRREDRAAFERLLKQGDFNAFCAAIEKLGHAPDSPKYRAAVELWRRRREYGSG